MHRALLTLLLLATVSPLYAQQASTTDTGTRFGVGIRLGGTLDDLFVSNRGLASSGAAVLVPIDILNTVRVEPEVALARTSSSSDFVDTSTSLFTIGVGVLPLTPRGDFMLYAGGRLRYTRAEEEVTFNGDFGPDEEVTTSSIGIGPVVGGEHAFSRWFSLGAEAGLEHRTFSSEVDGEEVDGDASSLATRGAVFVRFFFN